MNPHASSCRPRIPAFTIIELLVVLVILGILAAIIGPNLFKRPDEAKRRATLAQMASLETVINTFFIDNGRFPRTEEGLDALLVAPADLAATWKGPYLKTLPQDGWQQPFIYRTADDPGIGYFLVSVGKDAAEGTPDDIDRTTLQ